MSFFDKCREARATLTAPETVATLDYMEDYFGDRTNWAKGVYTAADGARCLRAAAEHARVSKVDDTKYWLRQAIAESEPHLKTIEQYNDTREEFGEIVAVIRRAREMALAAQLPAVRPAAALPAPATAEVLPPDAPAWLPAARPAPAMIDMTPLPEPPRGGARAPRRRSLFWEILSD